MSWQPYVDNNMVGSRHMAKAAIHGADGTCWATSPGFAMDPTVVKKIYDGFANKDKFANGEVPIMIQGEKYMFLKMDSDDQTQTKFLTARLRGSGATIAITGKCLLIGVFTEQVGKQELCNTTVTKLADYLISVGY